jgi:tRNA pseudouridine55 synthase
MSRRKRGDAVNGMILLDKPAGMSSNRALQKVRGLFNARKAGHTGNLDPFATGMLPVCLGEATKTAAFMIDADKTYHAKARLGSRTETGDIEGPIVESLPVPALDEAKISSVFGRFSGEIEQVPPMYSALKYKGQPLYKLARKGETVERAPRKCTIHFLRLLAFTGDLLEFEVSCSKGTYIRTLAEDIARGLGTCAHLLALRRTRVDPFPGEDMITLEQLQEDAAGSRLDERLLPVDAGLAHWPELVLDAERAAAFIHGNPVQYTGEAVEKVRVSGPGQWPLGLGSCSSDGLLRPRRVYNIDPSGDLKQDS